MTLRNYIDLKKESAKILEIINAKRLSNGHEKSINNVHSYKKRSLVTEIEDLTR